MSKKTLKKDTPSDKIEKPSVSKEVGAEKQIDEEEPTRKKGRTSSDDKSAGKSAESINKAGEFETSGTSRTIDAQKSQNKDAKFNRPEGKHETGEAIVNTNSNELEKVDEKIDVSIYHKIY